MGLSVPQGIKSHCRLSRVQATTITSTYMFRGCLEFKVQARYKVQDPTSPLFKKGKSGCKTQYLLNGLFKFATSIVAKLQLIEIKSFSKLLGYVKHLPLESC